MDELKPLGQIAYERYTFTRIPWDALCEEDRVRWQDVAMEVALQAMHRFTYGPQ